jgi:hypothetical protein
MIIALVITMAEPAWGFNQDLKNWFKFGLSLGFNEARTTCRFFNQPQNAGGWLDGGSGSCQGAWGELYIQNYLRNPQTAGDAWVRADLDLKLTFQGERQADLEEFRIANSNMFLEVGQALPREALIWFGKRSYHWEELWVIKMNIASQEGPGAGIYNLNINNWFKFGLAYFFVTPSSEGQGPAQTAWDIRFTDIPLLNGRLNWINVLSSTGAQDARTGERRYASLDGFKTALIHNYWLPDGENKLAILWGQGLFGGSDDRDLDQGTWIQANGAWRNSRFLEIARDPSLREALKQSYTLRIGEQLSFWPQEKPWSLSMGVGYQLVHFGGLRFAENDELYERPDMRSFVVAVKPEYRFDANHIMEISLGHLNVDNGLGYWHRLADGSYQESIRPVDQRMTNLTLRLNYRPTGAWQQQFSVFGGHSWWNDEMRRDISDGLYPERTSGLYFGVSSKFEL